MHTWMQLVIKVLQYEGILHAHAKIHVVKLASKEFHQRQSVWVRDQLFRENVMFEFKLFQKLFSCVKKA